MVPSVFKFCNLGLQDMDSFLGPYPHEKLKKWVSLTNHITKDLLERVQPKCKKISSVTELPQEPQHTRATASASEDAILSIQRDPETEIRFTEFPRQKYPEGASPTEISKCSMDSSYALGCLFNCMNGELVSWILIDHYIV